MAITVKCTQCGTVVAAPDSAAGKKGRCTLCGEIMDIPAPPPPPPPPVPGIRAVEDEEFELQETAGSEPAPPASSPQPRSSHPAQSPKNALDEILQKPSRRSKNSGMSCGIIAIVMIAIFGIMTLGGGAVIFVVAMPAFMRARSAAREAAALATVEHLAQSQQTYFLQNGEYAPRISGPKSLQSAGFVSASEAAADAANANPQPNVGFCYRILTKQSTGSYIDAQGRMTKGFAILAYQVSDESIVRAYLCGPDGAVLTRTFDKDSGEGPENIQSFDPQGWTPVLTPPPSPTPPTVTPDP